MTETSSQSVSNRQGTWRQAIGSLALSVFAVLVFRWLIFEPYVIPSGSMIPTLLELDYIYVNKFAYGIRLPFSSRWILERRGPDRCDVIVFRSQTEPGQFIVKRVIGLPGEKVELFSSGSVRINGVPLKTEAHHVLDDGRRILSEDCGNGIEHNIQVESAAVDDADFSGDPEYSIVVPDDQYVMFGDNRHQSADSRIWGSLHRRDFLGEAQGIWLSCSAGMPGMPRVCNPLTIRWDRLAKRLSRASAKSLEGPKQ